MSEIEELTHKLSVITKLNIGETLTMGYIPVYRSTWVVSIWRSLTGENILATIEDLTTLYTKAIDSKVLHQEIEESLGGLVILQMTYVDNIVAYAKLDSLIKFIKENNVVIIMDPLIDDDIHIRPTPEYPVNCFSHKYLSYDYDIPVISIGTLNNTF